MKDARPLRRCAGATVSLALVLLGSMLASGAAWGWARTVSGITQPLEIVRDVHGVPHIYAGTEADAYFALGYVHAEDRLWQMELNRRSASGTLSELFGASTVADDRLIRSVGLRRAASRNLQYLEQRTVRILDAYVSGVNAYLAQATVLPPEFLLLRAKPSVWTAEDSLTWLKMMAWTLSGNWWEELLNVRLRQRLSAREMAEVQPPYPGDAPLLLPEPQKLYGDISGIARSLAVVGWRSRPERLGSNNWVVSGARTRSGKPLLANDPHTKLSAPSLWYVAHLHAPGLNIIGATLPGVPGVFLGRNERVAWAFTNTGPDTQDLYVERLAGSDGARYLTPHGTALFERIGETIHVKGQGSETLSVRITRHGPVVSDVTPEAASLAPPGTAMALSWAGLQPDDLTAQFMVHAATAGTAAELHEVARFLHTPQQNLVYADVDGAIGFVAAGRVPLRSDQNDVMGLLPAPGWDERYDWSGFIAFEQLPRVVNPSDGKIVTANQKITPAGYRHWITSGWFPPYRADRITELLDQTPVHTVGSFADMQRDVKSQVARQLLPYLLQVEPANGLQRAVTARLKAWDQLMTQASGDALIFAEWIRQLHAVLLKDKLGDLYEALDDYNPVFLFNVLSDKDGQSRWCGAPRRDAPHPCDEAIAQALGAALAELRKRHGDNWSQWAWGRAHVALAPHQPPGALGLLSGLVDFRTESPGAMDTINVSGYAYDAESGLYRGEVGATYRVIYDLEGLDNSVFILNTGQSGNPFSSHYGDMADQWLGGGYVPMMMDRNRIIERSVSRVHLRPA